MFAQAAIREASRVQSIATAHTQNSSRMCSPSVAIGPIAKPDFLRWTAFTEASALLDQLRANPEGTV
jgi:hypothetical protein